MPLYRAEVVRRPFTVRKPRLHNINRVLYLPFDKDDGSIARDRSGYGNHGTIYGASRVVGKIGQALSFDGVDDYVEIPHSSSIDVVGDITIALWAKGPTPTVTDIANVIKRGAAGCVYQFFIGFNDGKLHWYDSKNGSSPFYPSATVIAADTWYHLAAVIESNLLKYYINGVVDANSYTLNARSSYSVPLTLAINPEHGYKAKGDTDEVRIYNKAKTAEEIRRLMYMRGI